MKRNILFSMIALLALVGCNMNDSGRAEYDDYDLYLAQVGCENPNAGVNGVPCIRRADDAAAAGVKEIKYSTPNGNDLVLETPEYILQIEGAPNKKYDYYVWTGKRGYNEDPDLIIQDGNAAVLVVE